MGFNQISRGISTTKKIPWMSKEIKAFHGISNDFSSSRILKIHGILKDLKGLRGISYDFMGFQNRT